MKTLRITILAVMTALSAVYAAEPSSVNGVVGVIVDRSKPKWKVTIHNQSKDTLTYEMLEGAPRGLGVEHWFEGKGSFLHTRNLAESADVDGFPADMRELKAGAKVVFELDPAYVSSTDPKALDDWKLVLKHGFYKCRVTFGQYGSRMINGEPEDKK